MSVFESPHANVTGLIIAFAGGSSGSSMTISGTGRVDVETAAMLDVRAGGTLNVLDDGVLIWHDRLVSEATGFAGTVNAIIKQVGSDVHFIAVPAPAALPAGLAMIGLVAARTRAQKRAQT